MTETMIETIELTAEKAHELMREAVAEKGEDYVYESPLASGECAYLTYADPEVPQEDPTGPSCIVGQVLVRVGVPLEILRGAEGFRPAKALAELADRGVIVDCPARVVSALNHAQIDQDTGKSWGEALRTFEQWVGMVPA